MRLLETLQRKKGKKWLIFHVFYSMNFLFLVGFLFMLNLYWTDVNLIVSDSLGHDVNLIFILLMLVIVPFFYGIFLTINSIHGFKKSQELKPHAFNKAFPFISIIFLNLLFALILINYKNYSYIIFKLIEFYNIFFHIITCVGLTLLLYPLFKVIPYLKFYLSEKRVKPDTKAKLILGFILTCYIFAFSSPLLFIPANVIYEELPPKPGIIAHRGASHVALENTIIAGKLAHEHGAIGWEVDVRVSADGKLFLMHDDMLTRTTNVEDVFPDRKRDDSESFTLSELRQLDAGSWFAEIDPYNAIGKGLLTKEELEGYKGLQIPLFDEILDLTIQYDFFIDIDMKGPPSNHPYRDTYFKIILNSVIDSGIDLTKVMIITDDVEEIALIKAKGANDILLGWNMRDNPSMERYKASEIEYQFLSNGDDYTNNLYRSFRDNEVLVMVYTVDSSERFSQLWCLGATWVMSNEVHAFNTLKRPSWYMQIDFYLIIWFLIYLFAVSSALLFRVILLRKNKK